MNDKSPGLVSCRVGISVCKARNTCACVIGVTSPDGSLEGRVGVVRVSDPVARVIKRAREVEVEVREKGRERVWLRRSSEWACGRRKPVSAGTRVLVCRDRTVVVLVVAMNVVNGRGTAIRCLRRSVLVRVRGVSVVCRVLRVILELMTRGVDHCSKVELWVMAVCKCVRMTPMDRVRVGSAIAHAAGDVRQIKIRAVERVDTRSGPGGHA